MRKSIWKIGGFLPYVVVVFLNAFTDLGHKIIIQNTVFKIYDGETQIILTAIVNALILLPFIMLFSPSGFIADRFSKSRVMRISAGLAVIITLMITLSYYLGMFELAFVMTFLLAVQSAIYSPAKYGYIKELVGNNYITMGNGVVQAVTTVSILSGIFVYSIFFENYLEGVNYQSSSEILQHIAPIGWLLVFGSVIEFFLAYRLPDTHIENEKRFSFSSYIRMEYLKKNLMMLHQKEIIFTSILGLSLFWGISQVVLSSFPEYAKNTIGITNTIIVQGMMAVAGIGIVIGSVIAGKVSRNHIEIGTIPLGALGITLSLLLLPSVTHPVFLALNFFMFGVASGLFIVPLNALIQYHSKEHELGIVLAGNNFIQNVVMFSFLTMTVLFALMGLESIGLFYLMLLFALGGTLYLLRKMPQSLVQFLITSIVSVRFKLKVLNFENFPQAGGVLMLGNHISWVDWALVQMAVPRRVRFVMDRSIYERWYLKRFLDFFAVIPVSPRAMKQAIIDVERLLREGEVVCIFPEGTISRNGQLGSFKRGFEKMVGDADGVILPFYLRGLWGDPLSRSSERLKELRRQRHNDVMIAFGKPLNISSRAREVKQKVFELSYTSWEQYTTTLSTLPEAWIETAKGKSAKRSVNGYCSVDWRDEKLSHLKMLTGTMLFARRVCKIYGDRVGILMPASSAGAMINMAALMAGKEVVNLNYTASEKSLRSALQKSDIRTVYTASRFLKKLEVKGLDMTSLFDEVEVIDLEAVEGSISKVESLGTLVQARLLPATILKRVCLEKRSNNDVAVILFSSGSEGEPKGVMLTHRNIMANMAQVFDVLNVREEDVILSTLPLFHAFGLTVSTLFPMVNGIPMVCYPDPTNPKGIGRVVARYRASVIFGTSTFYRLYTKSRKIDPLMFQSIRFAIAGAEKLDPFVKQAFEEKYNREILEGYGVTESAPVASVNLPDILETSKFTVQRGNKLGTVGLPLPGTAFRIVDPMTMEELERNEDGLILIGGAQVMKGYLEDPERTKSVIVELDGMRWYKTGDKGHIDEDGFLTIVDRYSRFAKLGGEMVSLGAVEAEIKDLLQIPEMELMAVALPDDKKGERVVVMVSGIDDVSGMKATLTKEGMQPLHLPHAFLLVDEIPKLGTGKSDFSSGKKMAIALLDE
ncbi:MAG: acyl-[ACP]--phospholipid O-acyltransferase [Epsilonproteobacteria bacterium]|nr:MAG: acyl-[ACP]--phospholipid O-acyltransferase [Campylobacterota bacterium]